MMGKEVGSHAIEVCSTAGGSCWACGCNSVAVSELLLFRRLLLEPPAAESDLDITVRANEEAQFVGAPKGLERCG
jgi:hypothetical protein